MKICGISDMHGQLAFKIEQCDLVLICGDIVPLRMQSDMESSEGWFKMVFLPWCTDLRCDKVIFIGGNHDFFLANHGNKVKAMLDGQDKVVFLDCETYEYGGKKIYGTPLCKMFGKWAYMFPYNVQDETYELQMDNIKGSDIIIAHDAPYGVSDVLLQETCPWADGSHIGNESLAKLVEKIQPSLMLHGHLHSTSHEKEKLGITDVYCVSLLDENYKLSYKPLYIEI